MLLPDGTLVVFQASYSSVGLNNPDELGVFQVVGRHVMWDVTIDGHILATTALVDASGTQFYAYDVNDFGQIAGFVYVDNDPLKEQIPAIGRFVEGQLESSLLVNPSPEVITGFADMQIDNGGNVLGYGVEPSSGAGLYARAVIWPASGGAIDLAAGQRLTAAQGNGIATVDGMLQVVGDAYARMGTFPYLYANGELRDLNGISEGDEPWEILGVEGVNHAVMICGYGRVGKRRDYRTNNCLLIPTNR